MINVYIKLLEEARNTNSLTFMRIVKFYIYRKVVHVNPIKTAIYLQTE